jgi:hypothetical protein
LEIENNLNLELMAKKKEMAFKTEKRINIIIKEADENLEATRVIDIDSLMKQQEEDEEEKDEDEDQEEEEKEMIEGDKEDDEKKDKLLVTMRKKGHTSLTANVLNLDRNLTKLALEDPFKYKESMFHANKREGTIPYVRKRIFFKAKAQFATPPAFIGAERIKMNLLGDIDNAMIMDVKIDPTKDQEELPEALVEQLRENTLEDDLTLGVDRRASIALENKDDDEDYNPAEESLQDSTDLMNELTAQMKYQLNDLMTIRKYILKNRLVLNENVRAAEISAKLTKNALERPFKHLTNFQKFIFVLTLPAKLLAWLTVFPTSKAKYSKIRYLCASVFGVLFAAFIVSYRRILTASRTSQIFVLSAALIFGVGTQITLQSGAAPTGMLRQFYYVLGALQAFLWLFFLSDMLLSVIIGLNIMFNYSYTFMMVSCFSFWAWLPVYSGNVKIVSLMKEIPGYGGSLFNMFFVFGITTAVQCFLHGPREVNVWPASKTESAFQLFLYVCLNIGVLVLIFFFVKLSGKRYTRLMGVILVFLYLAVVGVTFVFGIFASD